ncbi:MAG: hypothetical protein ABJF50_24675 [Paracoccaceae bacterium]
MVTPFAFLVFLIFTVGVAPFATIVMLGASNTVIFVALIALSFVAALSLRRVKIVDIHLILIALAINELVMSGINGNPSINFVRIVSATLAVIILDSRPVVLERFLSFLRSIHVLVVYGFVASVLIVAVAGSGVLHEALPLSDGSVLRKLDYTGELKIRSLFVFNFNTIATPAINIFSLNVLPSGLASESHTFFSFTVISMLLLIRSGSVSWTIWIATLCALVLSFSVSNGIGLVVAGSATALFFLFRCFSVRKVGLGLLFLLMLGLALYLRLSGLLSAGRTHELNYLYDRSIAESYAAVARFFAFDFGRYPLEALPNFFNGYEIFPLGITSFALFSAFLAVFCRRVFQVANALSYTDLFLLSYAFSYSFKSFGVMIFQPYILISILLILLGTVRLERR